MPPIYRKTTEIIIAVALSSHSPPLLFALADHLAAVPKGITVWSLLIDINIYTNANNGPFLL